MLQHIKLWLRKQKHTNELNHIFGFGYRQYLPLEQILTILETTPTPIRAVGIERNHNMIHVLVWKRYPRSVYRHTHDFPDRSGLKPDYDKLSIRNEGKTIAFGDYEVPVEQFVGLGRML